MMKTMGNEDKWLLISCLQKSIRKGFEILAMSYADKLFDLDPNYLIYRLSIIALEDIGLANINIISDFLSCQNDYNEIKNRGGKNYILQVVKDFSNGNKDRTAADLTELAKISNPLDLLEVHNLENIFTDTKEPLVRRLLAGWELVGRQKLKNPLTVDVNKSIDYFKSLNASIIKDKKIINILNTAYIIHKEPYFIALGLLSTVLEQERGFNIGKYKTGDIIEKEYIQIMIANKWLIDGIDWHTKEGKIAIQEFLNSKTNTLEILKRLGVSYETLPSVIGLLMFRLNGDDLNKRLVYPSAVLIAKLTERLEFKKIIKNEQADFIHIMKVFKEEYPILQIQIENTFKIPDRTFFPF